MTDTTGATGAPAPRGLQTFRDGDFPYYTLTFVLGPDPAELLLRMGADPDSLALRDGIDLEEDFPDDLLDDEQPVVTTGTDNGWTWAWEQGGAHGLDERVLRAVSAGTEAVVLHHNEDANRFKYAADGTVLADICDLLPFEPAGTEPSRLTRCLRPLGFLPGGPVPPYGLLSLAESAFGLGLTVPGVVDDLRTSGRLRPLPE
ncbi:DUF6461 domain-containing protein [Kitasatospora cineracea]